MTTTFELAEVGDFVWDIAYGDGVITSTNNGNKYPITVKFSDTHSESYTMGGCPNIEANQTLFWEQLIVVAPRMPKREKFKDINGFKVLDVQIPNEGSFYYYCPKPHLAALVDKLYTYNNEYMTHGDKHRKKFGLRYPANEKGKEAAIAHARAMLGYGDEWYG